MQTESNRSISFRELNWDEIDTFAKSHGFKDRSPFIESCVKTVIKHKRLGNLKIIEVITLLLLAIVTLMISLIIIRG